MLQLRYLSRSDALRAGAGDWRAAVRDVRAATLLLRRGQARLVPESAMAMGRDPREHAYALPASLAGDYDAAGLKWAVHRGAPRGDMPSIVSTTLVNRLSDGRPLGMVESALLTRMRTAAVTAIAIETLMAKQPLRAAILGAGAQARAHLEMASELFPELESIRVWNRTPAHRDAMLAELSPELRARISVADTLPDAIDESQVVISCTTATQPLLGAWAVRPGRLIVQVGYHEMAFEAIDASQVIAVDLWGGFAATSAKSLFQMHRSGRFEPGRVAADLAALVVDEWRPPGGASLYFSSFGLNIFDIALAARVLRQAEAENIGVILPLL